MALIPFTLQNELDTDEKLRQQKRICLFSEVMEQVELENRG